MERKIKTVAAYRIDVPPEEEFEDYRDRQRVNYQFSKYDRKGNLIEEVRFDDFGEVIGKSIYSYDDGGNLLGEETYDELGELEEKLTYERDENGRIVNRYIHYLDGSKDTVFYEYDTGGRLICKTLKDEDGEIERVERIRYADGAVVEEEVMEEGETVKRGAGLPGVSAVRSAPDDGGFRQG
jgi:YD repeat-containing protein